MVNTTFICQSDIHDRWQVTIDIFIENNTDSESYTNCGNCGRNWLQMDTNLLALEHIN